MVKEAGGIVNNDINKFDINNIDIKASSTAINDEMNGKFKELLIVF